MRRFILIEQVVGNVNTKLLMNIIKILIVGLTALVISTCESKKSKSNLESRFYRDSIYSKHLDEYKNIIFTYLVVLIPKKIPSYLSNRWGKKCREQFYKKNFRSFN